MARNHDRHRCAVEYRTARMAAKDAENLRTSGWGVSFTDDPKILHVHTYKPTVLFGDYGMQVTRRPLDGAAYREAEAWRRGIVRWSLACGCGPWRLETDYRPAGIRAELQPVGMDGRSYFGAAEYVIERVNWSCVEQSERAQVAVRTPDEEHWSGRMVMVAESVIVAMLNLTSAQRQCYIETGDIPDVNDTYPVED